MIIYIYVGRVFLGWMENDLSTYLIRPLLSGSSPLSSCPHLWHFHLCCSIQSADELAPLDEHGKPKYTGKKRGRKPKPKKRRRKPGTPKRKHTGYTLFMAEHYPQVKMAMAGRVPEAQSKDVISSVANSWKSLSDEDKEAWKERARSLAEEEGGVDAAAAAGAGSVEEEEEDPYHHAATEYAVEHDMGA